MKRRSQEDGMNPPSASMPAAVRRIARKTRAGAPSRGFAGPGHTAVEVVRADALAETSPFVLRHLRKRSVACAGAKKPILRHLG
jgi:hypothetical protein